MSPTPQLPSLRSPTYARLVRNLVRLHGGNPEPFRVVLENEALWIRCDGVVAYYPLAAWTSSFLRHLLRGYFTPWSAPHPRPGEPIADLYDRLGSGAAGR